MLVKGVTGVISLVCMADSGGYVWEVGYNGDKLWYLRDVIFHGMEIVSLTFKKAV